jgi:hypothetical protein
MRAPVVRSRQTHLITALTLTLVTVFAASLPAAAFSGEYTTPKRVWSSPGAPNHTMATDGSGNVHITTERGGGGDCCSAPPSLYLTHLGSPRVAYGDGTSRADGVKYASRTPKSWKKTKAANGRVKQVALALDRTPGLFGNPPGNGPAIAYVIKGKGTYYAGKGGSGVGGGWGKRFLGKAFGPLDLQVGSNLTFIVQTANGNLKYARHSGGIWFGGKPSGSGADSKPQLDEGRLTFGRSKGTTGIYYTRRK